MMITGKALLSFIRQASRINSDKNKCIKQLDADISDFPQAVYILFSAFVIQMVRIGILPSEMLSNAKCGSIAELKTKNRSVLRNLRIGKSRLLSKSEYNFGICFLYLYYFQHILDILLPKDMGILSDDIDEEDIDPPIPLRVTQEEVVMLLTGSKDRTNVHNSVEVVCIDLAEIMNRQLNKENPRFQRLLEKIKNQPGNRSITLLQGIKGSGKTDFLLYLTKTNELNTRYYPRGILSDITEAESWICSCTTSANGTPEKEILIILENAGSFSVGEVYDLTTALEKYEGKERIQLICTSRSKKPPLIYSLLSDSFSCQTLDIPMMDAASITDFLEQENILLDPETIRTVTCGYPPLVTYCILHHTTTIPKQIYFKAFTMLFNIHSIKELVRLRLFITLMKENLFHEKDMNFTLSADNTRVLDWHQFLEKAEENGLLKKGTEPGTWIADPVVAFLSEMLKKR